MTCSSTPATAHLVGDPVDTITGDVVENVEDFSVAASSPIAFRRMYVSSRCREDRGLGRGHGHIYDQRLQFDLDGIRYIDSRGTSIWLPAFPPGEARISRDGYILTRLGSETELDRPDGLRFLFSAPSPSGLTRPVRLSTNAGAIEIRYDNLDRLSSLHGSDGHVVAFRWDADHIVEARALTDAGRNSVFLGRWHYQTDLLVAFEDAYHHRARYEYDHDGRLVRRHERNGYYYEFTYDTAGRCVRTTGADGLFDTRLSYFPLEQRTEVVKSDGSAWTYQYDASKTLTQIIGPGGITRSFVLRPDDGKLASEIDGAGNERSYVYDADGRLVGEVDSLGRRFVDEAEFRVPVRADEYELGTLVEQAHTYPAPSDLSLALPPFILTQLVFAIGAHDGRIRETRDIQGALIREECDGRTRRYAYDPNGNFRWDIDFDGLRTDWAFAGQNQLVALRDPNGAVTRFEYSTENELSAVTDPLGTRTSFPRDSHQNLTGVARANAWKEEYVNDGAGRLVEKRDASGKMLYTLELGPQGEVLRCNFASGGFEAFVYDDRLQLVEAATAECSQTFAYDYHGNTTRDMRDGRGVECRFVAGELVEQRVLERFVTRYRYRRDDSSTELFVTDPTGREHHIRDLGHGIVLRTFASERTEATQFHPDGRILGRFVYSAAEPKASWSRRFEYSGEGDLVARHDSSSGSTAYRNDATRRLVAEVPPNAPERVYAHDQSGNLTCNAGATATYAPGNLLATAGGRRYEHDLRHAIATEQDSSFSRRFVRDERDQLVRIETHRAQATGAWSTAAPWLAKYDALNRRIEKSVGADRTVFYWENHRLAAEIRPDGGLRVYVYADPIALTPIVYVDYASVDTDVASGTTYAVFADHQGCPERIEDMCGEIVWAASVAPYGKLSVHVGAHHHQPLRWPGHYHDAEVDLHYNRFRTYAPDLGRYLEPDPLGRGGRLENVYAYTQNPLSSVDIDGLKSPCKECEKKRKADEKRKKGKPHKEEAEAKAELERAKSDLARQKEKGQGDSGKANNARWRRYLAESASHTRTKYLTERLGKQGRPRAQETVALGRKRKSSHSARHDYPTTMRNKGPSTQRKVAKRPFPMPTKRPPSSTSKACRTAKAPTKSNVSCRTPINFAGSEMGRRTAMRRPGYHQGAIMLSS